MISNLSLLFLAIGKVALYTGFGFSAFFVYVAEKLVNANRVLPAIREKVGKMPKFEVRNPEMPSGFGFAFLIFSYEPGSMFYISSAERDTVIAAMREFIQKHEHN